MKEIKISDYQHLPGSYRNWLLKALISFFGKGFFRDEPQLGKKFFSVIGKVLGGFPEH